MDQDWIGWDHADKDDNMLIATQKNMSASAIASVWEPSCVHPSAADREVILLAEPQSDARSVQIRSRLPGVCENPLDVDFSRDMHYIDVSLNAITQRL